VNGRQIIQAVGNVCGCLAWCDACACLQTECGRRKKKLRRGGACCFMCRLPRHLRLRIARGIRRLFSR